MSTESAPVTGSVPVGHGDRISPQSKLVIYLLLVSAFVVMLNETIVGVALPRIYAALGIDPAVGQWLITAYMLTMALVIPLTGFIMKRLTTRTIFLGAIGLFLAGTVVGALAQDFAMLVIARVLQASGTGVMLPLLMTTIMTLVPISQRGRMMGNISIVMSVAPVVGPLVGGLIINWLPWQALFIVVLPFALTAWLLGFFKMVNITETEKVPVDFLSIVLSAFAFGGLVFGLSEFGNEVQGQGVISPWIPLGIGAVALVAFVFRQLRLQKKDDALIDLRIFESRGFTMSVLMMTVMNAVLFGSLVLLPLYIQNALGLSPLQSALIVMPGSLLMGIAGPFVGALYDRFGPRPLLVPGSAILVAALWLMAIFFTATTPMWLVLILYIVLCSGLALMFAPLFTVAMAGVAPKYYSYASAGIGTIQQLAGAAGTSGFMVIFTTAAVAAGATADGAPNAAQTAAGTHLALLVAAFASFAVFGLSWFIRRPADEVAHRAQEGAPIG